MDFIRERPLTGYGYQGFWTPDHIFLVSNEFDWTIPNAHSVIVDLLLNVGVLGAVCLITGLLSGMLKVVHQCRRTGTPAACFACAMGIFALVSALFESGMEDPTAFDSFFVTAALLLVLLKPVSPNTQVGDG